MRDATDRDTANAYCMVDVAIAREKDDPELLRLLRVAHSALKEVRNLGYDRFIAGKATKPTLTMTRTTIDDGRRVLEYHGRDVTARVWRERGDSLPWRMSTATLKNAPSSCCLRFRDACKVARNAAGFYPLERR